MAPNEFTLLLRRWAEGDESALDQLTPIVYNELHKLAMLQGDKFDHEFAEYMIKDHRKDIGEYEKAARMKGAVGDLARATLPTLHKHLSAAEKLKG